MPRLNSRGAVLVAVMIALGVLLLLVGAAILFTGKNREASAGKMQGDQLRACAEAARKHLLAKLRLFNVPITELTLNTTIPHGDKNLTITTGHYGDPAALPAAETATVVALTASAVSGSGLKARDLANAAPGTSTLGGQFYGVTVKCRDPAGREAELEFAFRYGL